MAPTPGWYADPADPQRAIRYWDGSAWAGEPVPRTSVRIGESIQRTGRSIAGIGAAITWIVIGVAAVFFIAVLIV